MATFSSFLSAFSGEGMTFRIRRARGIALLAGLLALTKCTSTPTIVENSATEVAVRYDGIVNNLDDAKQAAQKACAARDKVARLRKVDALGVGQHFGYFDCVSTTGLR
jgi:hypothetical protein